MMNEKKTPVVMITGAAGNLGSAAAEAFREQGARLALFDHHEDRLPELYPDLADSQEHYLAVSVDLTDSEQVKKAVKKVLDQLGQIDVLVNTVGGFTMGSRVDQLDPATWERMMDLNVQTLLNTAQAVLPHMRDRKSGAVINVGARPSLEGKPKMGAYSVAKAGVLRLTESLAAENKALGINVNCVIPGTIDTPENREAMPGADTDKWVQPASLAGVIAFLASPQARDIHGAAIPVYGS
jgi:NAD(P)-dependent dehydrogenase (short-subunit alcohol dehydrogenase family)